MKVKEKRWEILIPGSLEEVWRFFSRPENLEALTPSQVKFEILSDIRGMEMYEGMVIRYNISPTPGIKLNWMTEITHIREGVYFVDIQHEGPYAIWHHQHHFAEEAGSVRMTDILHYKVPYGPLGTVVNALYVERQLEKIFAFRETAVREKFG